MSEKNFQNAVCKELKNLGAHCSNHEGNRMGIPDTSFGAMGVNGWIEFKIAADYPVRDTTKIKFKHPLTPEQYIFMRKRGRAGGYCWTLCRVKRDYYLVGWRQCKALRDGVTKAQLRMVCTARWTGRIDYKELLHTLTMEIVL